jgi:hypothetical protein
MYLRFMTSIKQVFGVLLLLILLGCSSKKTDSADSLASQVDTIIAPEENYERWFDINAYIVASDVAKEDVQTVDSKAVIVISPTEEQIADLIKENGEEDFYTIADDASFYQSNAISQLDSFAIETVEAEKRYLTLVGNNQSWTVDIRQKGAPEWNMIFFDPRKPPKIVTAIDVTPEELLSYFGSDR